MTIALRSTGAVTTALQVSTITLAAPAGPQTGDVYVAKLASDLTITTPTGWTLMKYQAGTGIGGYMFCAPYSAGLTRVFALAASSTACGAIECYSGANTTNMQDATANGQAQSSTSVTAPSITTVTDGAMLVYLGAVINTNTTATLFNTPWSTEAWEGAANTNNNNNYVHGEGVYAIQATAGASGTKTSGISATGQNVGILGALKPASGVVSAAVSLAKVIGFADSATGVFPRGTSFAKTLAISQGPGVKRYPAMTLNKALTIVLDGVTGGLTYQVALAMARTMGFTDVGPLARAGLLSLNKTLTISQTPGAQRFPSMSLAKSLSISQTPGVKRYPTVTLSKTIGFTDSATGVFPRGTSFAKTMSFSDAGGLQRQVTVTFSRTTGFSTVNIITKNVAMSLARSMTISQTPGVKRYPGLTLTKTLGYSDIARGAFNHGVTFGRTLVIAETGSLNRLVALTLARTLALSTIGNINTTKTLVLALALQLATDGSTVGIATALIELILGGRSFELDLAERLVMSLPNVMTLPDQSGYWAWPNGDVVTWNGDEGTELGLRARNYVLEVEDRN